MEREGFGLGYSGSLPIGVRVCEASGAGFVLLPAPKPKQKGFAEICVCVEGEKLWEMALPSQLPPLDFTGLFLNRCL